MKIWPAAPLLVLCALVAGATVGCFRAPAAAVLFRCTQGQQDACPPGYTCESDGCCHKQGTDLDANYGECALSVGGGSDTGSDSGDASDTSGGSDSGSASDTGS